MKRSVDTPGTPDAVQLMPAPSPKRRRHITPKDVGDKLFTEVGFVDDNDNITLRKRADSTKSNSSKANARKERNESMESTISMSTFIENNLSEKAKHALIRLEKNKAHDPFNEENQMLIDEFTAQVTQQKSTRDVSLAEAGVLLDGVGQIYSRQVKRLHADVLALATFCAITPKPKPKDVNKDGTSLKNPEEVQNSGTETNHDQEAAGDSGVAGEDITDPNSGTAAGETMDGTQPEGKNESGQSGEGPVPESDVHDGSQSSSGDALPETHIPTEEEQNLFLQSLVLDGVNTTNLEGENGETIGPEFNTENLVASTPTKEANNRVGASAGTRGAKKVYSINELLKDHSFFKALGIALTSKGDHKAFNPRIKVPKLVAFYKIPFIDSGDQGPPPLDSSLLPDPVEIEKSSDLLTDINKNLVNNITNPEPVTLKSMVPEGVELEGDKVKEDTVFKAEDLVCIHKFIQQLHYLSLNTQVSEDKKKGLFKNAVGQLQKIFETYNVTQSGATVASDTGEINQASTAMPVPSSSGSTSGLGSSVASVAGSSPASTPCPASRKSSTEEEESNLNLDLESMHESFSESFDEESTVMQRTKEKSRKESRHRLQEVLSTILSPIVKKHSVKPLIEEHSEAFFRKVESFQSRMKKILEEEKRKEQFNLTTYEQELLEVANKDMDSDDGSQVANHDSNTLHDAHESDPISRDFAQPQSPCRSETSSNSNGLKWIKLDNLFAHVKHQDRREAARYFCAVLGLLSFENFDVNYDKFYDEASAKKVKKVLDCSQDQKYPRGAKIVKSRCPDVNEVFVTALSSVSRTETFRQKEHGMTDEDIKKMHQAEFLEATGAQAAFEQVQGEIYSGELFSKRSRAMQARKLLKAQAQAKKEDS